jgi:hypothetical protein
MSAKTKYEHALTTMPAPGGAGCHVAILATANLGVMAGISAGQLFEDIKRAIPKGTRVVPDREIEAAVQKASREVQVVLQAERRERDYMTITKKAKPEFDGKHMRHKLIEQSKGAQEVDLWELSPVRLDSETGAWESVLFLESMYSTEDVVFIGDTYDKETFTVADHIDFIKSGVPTKPQIIMNPLYPEPRATKDGNMSKRCDASVCDYRFMLIEFDDISKGDQIAFWYSMIVRQKMRIACLIDTGGKSIHAWVNVGLKSIEQWEEIVVNQFYGDETGWLTLLGADRACKNPSRLSRLPGHFRQEKQQWQRLLYLNPQNNV